MALPTKMIRSFVLKLLTLTPKSNFHSREVFCWELELAMLSKEVSFICSFVLNFSTFDYRKQGKSE